MFSASVAQILQLSNVSLNYLDNSINYILYFAPQTQPQFSHLQNANNYVCHWQNYVEEH